MGGLEERVGEFGERLDQQILRGVAAIGHDAAPGLDGGGAEDLAVRDKDNIHPDGHFVADTGPLGRSVLPFDDTGVNRDGSRIPLSMSERSRRQGDYDYYGAQGVIDKINDYKFDGTLLLIAEDGQNLIRKNKEVAFFTYQRTVYTIYFILPT